MLKSDSLAAHIILEASWTFVVNHLELWAKAHMRWVDEGLCQGSRCDDGCIDGGCFGHWALVWKELHCLGGALSSGLGNIETVAAIVFWGRP